MIQNMSRREGYLLNGNCVDAQISEYKLICEFIKLRDELGLSQQKMADTVGVVR